MRVINGDLMLKYNIIYKILLSFIPVYFYYVPNFLIKKYFLKFINETFLTLGLEKSPAKSLKLVVLEKRVIRMVSFISFLSVWVATALAVILKKSTYQASNYNLFHIYLLCVFLVLGSIVIYKNLSLKDKFMVNRGLEYFETFTVYISVIIVIVLL